MKYDDETIFWELIEAFFEGKRQAWAVGIPETITMKLVTKNGFEKLYKWPRDNFLQYFRIPIYEPMKFRVMETGETPIMPWHEEIMFEFVDWEDRKGGIALYKQIK